MRLRAAHRAIAPTPESTLEQQKDEQRKDEQRKDREGKWALAVVASALLLLSAILFIWAGLTKHEYWKHVLFALAHAAIVVGAFSVLLELPHLTNFVVRELGKVIYGREYLERNQILIPEIRKTVDLVQYGEPALAHQGSLYNFIDRNIHQYYVSHYRRQYQEQLEISVDESGDIVLSITTRYILVRSPTRQRVIKPLEVPFSSTFVKSDRLNVLKDHLLELRLTVGAKTYRLDAAGTGLIGVAAHDIVRLKTEDIANRVEYEFVCEVPQTALSELGEVDVVIFEKVKLPYRNDVYAMRMSLPTQNFTLICNGPSRLRLIPTSFDMNPPEESTEALGHVVITINDWLLPGHGVCLAWDLPPKAGVQVEQRTGGDKQMALPKDTSSAERLDQRGRETEK